jgi:hypothetical protein
MACPLFAAFNDDDAGQQMPEARASHPVGVAAGPVISSAKIGSIRMRVVCAAVAIALLAGPAYAQGKAVPRYGETEKQKTRLEIEAEKAARKAYQDSLSSIPDKGPSDPWGNVRSDREPAAVEPAKTHSSAK